ncbi:ganglioside GM2 activator-like [Ruditapes philippinarum]|uniref:ganglioside GM2 activator-like n=1 Tax=Ruditapes philippinarum TaxID=129788 RepID=UPI00295A6F44|nr:ganglioside GM2 activator-like [Ruditapes philippinarum]
MHNLKVKVLWKRPLESFYSKRLYHICLLRNLYIVITQNKARSLPVKLKTFSFSDCGGPNALINLNQIEVTPDPLDFPGPLNVVANFKINSDVGSPMVGDVLIEKKVFGKFVKVPCIDNFGSCHYPDFCELLEQVQCPDPIKRIGIDCTCPLKAIGY